MTAGCYHWYVHAETPRTLLLLICIKIPQHGVTGVQLPAAAEAVGSYSHTPQPRTLNLEP